MYSFLRLQPAKTVEVSPEAQEGVLSSFLTLSKRNWWQRLLRKHGDTLAFEVYSLRQRTYFVMAVPSEYGSYFSSQLTSRYPKSIVSELSQDLLPSFFQPTTAYGVLHLHKPYWYPIKNYTLTSEQYPFASVLGVLAKLQEHEAVCAQLIIRNTPQQSLQAQIRKHMSAVDAEGNEKRIETAGIIETKLRAPLMEAQVRLISYTPDIETSKRRLQELAGAYGVYTLGEGNGLGLKRIGGIWDRQAEERMIERTFLRSSHTMALNTTETASLWHLPDMSLEMVKHIDWGRTLHSEPPDNLPVSEEIADVEKSDVNFFGKSEWRNRQSIFGIKRDDRRKHVYIIGKTGSGKSTLIANMAINDIRNGEGVAVIDPHGDLSEMILDYIPKRRLNDVIYLDPTLSESRHFSLNLFDDQGQTHTDLVASGIVSIFYKLYHHSWGPRLEYILRNCILTLLLVGDSTFADIPKLLTNTAFRKKTVARIAGKDPVLTAFWEDEFDKMNDRLRTDAVSPILNKVGQFLSSQRIRSIVGEQSSSFSFEEIMNSQKILIVNLSQGKLGEDSTALLGAMFITKIQLAAMSRVNLAQEQRKDFYLYVDEFQNFATHSFIKILSEARKYRLNLIMANQYIGQVDEDIQKAIFGNVGTLLSFIVGAADAQLLEREFGGQFSSDEIVGLGKFTVLMKMAIDGLTSTSFQAYTLPLPSVVNGNREKIIRVNLERNYRG